jgi:hypothetical protein
LAKKRTWKLNDGNYAAKTEEKEAGENTTPTSILKQEIILTKETPKNNVGAF